MDKLRVIKVAAFDTKKADAEKADFRCDGINDEVEISAADKVGNWRFGELRKKYDKFEWFAELQKHFQQRYLEIEKRIDYSFNFVTLNREQGSVYSHEYLKTINDMGDFFCSTLDVLINKPNNQPKQVNNFNDYFLFLTHNIRNLERQMVAVNYIFPYILFPFSAFKNNTKPIWWKAFETVRAKNSHAYKPGNLSNNLGFLAALAIIGFHLRCYLRTVLFVNVGLIYPPDDPAIGNKRILYKMS
jgi:hypothetical protein